MADTPTCVRSRGRRNGFSLIELMVVVIIIGILSAVAIPTFSSYVNKSRAAEATEFLGVIKLREESYRSEFGVYCPTVQGGNPVGSDVSALTTVSNLTPDPTGIRTVPHAFTSTNAVTMTDWAQLGARPSGFVRFGYGVAAGPPTTLPQDAGGGNFGFTTATADFWFIAQAQGDFDGDGIYITFEEYSAAKAIWIGGGDHASEKGWE